ncbi:MAG: hypothetical protein KAH01_01630 [Caldisericia bacterium]|nr:hypothetical protein [Caldisericia bacterium]
MTTTDLKGYVTVYLALTGDERTSFTLSNVKSDAADQDIFDSVTAIAALLMYPVDEILRHQKSNLNA